MMSYMMEKGMIGFYKGEGRERRPDEERNKTMLEEGFYDSPND